MLSNAVTFDLSRLLAAVDGECIGYWLLYTEILYTVYWNNGYTYGDAVQG